MSKRYKILITGAGGMLGVDLWQELDKDYDVYGLDIVQRTSYSVQRFYRGNITDRKHVQEIVLEIRPDIVIHTAAWTDVDRCEFDKAKAYKVNSEGTENVASACRKTGAMLIYISTDFVFDGRKKKPYKETDKPNPINIYAGSKWRGEEVIRKTLKKYFILRTSWLYGRYGKNFVDMILEKTKREKKLKVVDDQIGTPTYTKDLAKAIHVLLDKIFKGLGVRDSGFGIYHVSNSGSVSWHGYAEQILKLVKSETKVMPISSEELARPAERPAMSRLDNSKFTRFTGHKMRNWKKALREYLNI